MEVGKDNFPIIPAYVDNIDLYSLAHLLLVSGSKSYAGQEHAREYTRKRMGAIFASLGGSQRKVAIPYWFAKVAIEIKTRFPRLHYRTLMFCLLSDNPNPMFRSFQTTTQQLLRGHNMTSFVYVDNFLRTYPPNEAFAQPQVLAECRIFFNKLRIIKEICREEGYDWTLFQIFHNGSQESTLSETIILCPLASYAMQNYGKKRSIAFHKGMDVQGLSNVLRKQVKNYQVSGKIIIAEQDREIALQLRLSFDAARGEVDPKSFLYVKKQKKQQDAGDTDDED